VKNKQINGKEPMTTTNKLPTLDNISSFTFPNGMSVYVKENNQAPTVNVQLWVKTGSINEEQYLGYGLSHFLEHMVFHGTKKYSGSKLMETVHREGSEINAFTTFDHTVYYITGLSSSVATAIDILLELCTAPKFPSDAFKTEKEIILRERAMTQDSPDRMLGEKLWLEVFKSHPVRHPIIGYEDKIQAVNKKMMLEYYEKRYAANKMFFVITGDIQAKSVIELIGDKSSSIPAGNYYEPFIPAEKEQISERFHHTFFNDPIPRIALGYQIPDASNKDTIAMNLLASVLSEGGSSRLVHNLRDTKKLVVDIDAFAYATNNIGVFSITSCCETENKEQTVKEVLNELEKVSQGISEEELMRVKKKERTNFYARLRSNNGIASLIGNSVLTYSAPDFANKYLEYLYNLDSNDIVKTAEKYLKSARCSFTEIIPFGSKPLEQITAKRKTNNNQSKTNKPTLSTLPNKVRMIHFQNSQQPLIDISIIFPGGRIYETNTNAGITRMLGSLFLTGTNSYSEKELAELLDNNAISLNSNGGNNSLSFRIKLPSDSLKYAVKALRSILTEPLFEEDKLERERNITLELLKTRAMNPQRRAEDKLNEIMYNDHPYAISYIGTESTLKTLTVNEIRDFYHQCLNPEKCVISIAGDISKNKAKDVCNEIFSGLNWNNAEEIDISKIQPPKFPTKASLIKVPIDKEQSVVILGIPGCSNISQDRFPIDIIQTALDGMDSRMFKTIREDEGLAYYTGIYLSRGMHDGIIALYAGTNQQNSDKVVSLFNKEKKKLSKYGLTKKEYNTAIARLKTSMAEAQSNISALAFSAALSEYYGNGYMETWDQFDTISKITLKNLNNTLKEYFSNENETIVIAGA
jgi:zinc protease